MCRANLIDQKFYLFLWRRTTSQLFFLCLFCIFVFYFVYSVFLYVFFTATPRLNPILNDTASRHTHRALILKCHYLNITSVIFLKYAFFTFHCTRVRERINTNMTVCFSCCIFAGDPKGSVESVPLFFVALIYLVSSFTRYFLNKEGSLKIKFYFFYLIYIYCL